MFVSVLHTVHDPAVFQERGQSLLTEVPPGLAPHQFLPATDLSQAVCLWEGETLQSLQAHIDGTLGDASTQRYFTVADEYASGLPARR
jgi:hypothetical protein